MTRISWWRFTLTLALGAMVPLASHAGTLEVAVTVDDLPAHGPLPDGMTRLAVIQRMVETFRQHGVSTVYGFVNGAEIDANRDHAAAMLVWQQAGLPVANHTFSHLDLARVTAAHYIADIKRNEAAVERFGGTARFFRYPYLQEGETLKKRDAVRRWLSTHGYTIAHVTVSLDDWAWNEGYVRCLARGDTNAVAELRRSFVNTTTRRLKALDRLGQRLYGRPIRHILLLHAAAFTSAALDDMLSAYRAAGVTFVSLDVAAADPAYATDPGVVGDGRRTFLEQIAESRHVERPPDVEAPSVDEVLHRCR